MIKLCDCGCGAPTPIAKATRPERGWVKGQPIHCLPHHVRRIPKHGHACDSRSPTYRSWKSMWRRCVVPTEANYARYGGMGIHVCDRWKEYQNFLADMGGRPTGTTLDRIDPLGWYEPQNCRWATPTEQARNRRHNRLLTFGGKTMCVSAWGAALGLSPSLIRQRLDRDGMSVARALGGDDGE